MLDYKRVEKIPSIFRLIFCFTHNGKQHVLHVMWQEERDWVKKSFSNFDPFDGG